jgi:hypothetical protein
MSLFQNNVNKSTSLPRRSSADDLGDRNVDKKPSPEEKEVQLNLIMSNLIYLKFRLSRNFSEVPF